MNKNYYFILLNLLLSCTLINSLLLPSPPNNIVCFPERDFCTIENYLDYTGKVLTLNVIRNNVIMGSAAGTVSGDIIAFEVNHPGGLCWGDNTELKVTPNILIGDKIELKQEGLLLNEIIIQNGYITKKEQIGQMIKVTGFLDNSILPENIEIRIVNGDLKTTSIGRRDARAVVGPVGPVFTNYDSGIEITGTSFIATFIFTDITTANIAFISAYSLSMWQGTDPAGGGLGITISEFEEIGGPWSLLCPQYANYISTNLKKLIISDQTLKWDKNIQLLPGTDPITGFMAIITRNINADVNTVLGYKFSNNIDNYDFSPIGLKLTDKIDFRVVTNNKLSDPLLIELNNLNENPDIIVTPQSNPDAVVNTNIVTMSSNTGQIIYTIDNSIPSLTNGLIYTDSISILQPVTIKALSFSYGGKTSILFSGNYAPEIVLKTYLPPNDLKITQQTNSLSASWTNINDPTINLYKINIYVNNILNTFIETTQNPLIITNLIPNTDYTFSILARYDIIWSSESSQTNSVKFPNLSDNIIVTSAKWKSTDFRVTGTSSMPNVILTLYKSNPDNTISINTINIQGTSTPITGTSSGLPDVTNNYVFDIRVTKNQVPTKPDKFFIKSSKGGIAGPIII